MCGTYGFSVKDAREVYGRFAIINTIDDYKPRWNIRPGQNNLTVVSHSPNHIVRMKWGINLHVKKGGRDTLLDFHPINATVEKLLLRSFYREPLQFRRCIIPATYFIEPDKSVKPSIPHLFKVKEQDIFGLAGFYDEMQDEKTGETISTYTIITVPANELVGEWHPRMAAVLRKEDEAIWLNPDITDPQHLVQLLNPYPPSEMETWRVSQAINNVRNDYPELIKPVSD